MSRVTGLCLSSNRSQKFVLTDETNFKFNMVCVGFAFIHCYCMASRVNLENFNYRDFVGDRTLLKRRSSRSSFL